MNELIIRERERERVLISRKEALHWYKPSGRGYEALGGEPNG